MMGNMSYNPSLKPSSYGADGDMNWDPETLDRWREKLFLLPEDYNGAILILEGIRYRLDFLAMGAEMVVFNLVNLETGIADQVLKLFRIAFDPIGAVRELLDQSLGSISSNPDLTIKICSELLLLDPNDEVAAFNRAIAFAIKCDYERALESFDLAVYLMPDDVVNWINKAVALAYLNRHVEVAENLEAVADIDPIRSKEYLSQMSGQADILKESLRIALEQNPTNQTAVRAMCEFFQ